MFEQDFDHFMISQQYGHITPQQVELSPESVVNAIEAKYAARGDLHLYRIYLPDTPSSPYLGQLSSTDEQGIEVFVNPYTGKIIGGRSDKTLINRSFELTGLFK